MRNQVPSVMQWPGGLLSIQPPSSSLGNVHAPRTADLSVIPLCNLLRP